MEIMKELFSLIQSIFQNGDGKRERYIFINSKNMTANASYTLFHVQTYL